MVVRRNTLKYLWVKHDDVCNSFSEKRMKYREIKQMQQNLTIVNLGEGQIASSSLHIL